MSAAVAGTTPEPEIPATKPLGHHRRGPQNRLQSLDSIPVTRKFRPTASYTNPRDVTQAPVPRCRTGLFEAVIEDAKGGRALGL